MTDEKAKKKEVDIPDSEYVTVSPDGHLMCRGKHVRYWGYIGACTVDYTWDTTKGIKPGDSPEVRKKKLEDRYALMVTIANRIDALGFNLWRTWHVPTGKEWTKGDGSSDDLLGFFLNEMDKRGMKLWMATLHAAPVSAEDVDIINDPSTAHEWQNAIMTLAEKDKHLSTWCVATFWDPRLEAIGIRGKLARAGFRNHYKGGMRLADDPQVVVWELSNEEWWLRKMLRGEWQQLPEFFKQSLLAQWNAFLTKKYGNDEKLAQAWIALLSGESLQTGTVQLAPLLTNPGVVMPNDANPAVKEMLSKAAQGKLTRDDCARQRGADVIEFFVGLQIRHKQAEYKALKAHGKSCRLSPFIFDTGEGYSVQSLYMHQHADATSVCTYMTGIHNDPTHEFFPWNSGLTEPPKLCWNVPWVETQRVPNKPYFVYEIGYENPGKYRTEYPYKVAMLASIQDFDVICWHTGNGLADANDSSAYSTALQYSASENRNPDGLHYRSDEVFQSAMHAAGEIFKNCLVKPAPRPTTYTFGSRSMYDPATMDYGVSYGNYGLTILPTTYRYGTRMICDPNSVDDKIDGPVITRGVYEPNPYRPNEEITFDYRKGCLLLDAPGTATYTGFFARYGGPVKFRNGVVLDTVTVVNPPDMPYPIGPDELYISFSLASRDGKPLCETNDAIMSLVSTSFNTGFKVDERKIKNEYMWQNNPGATINIGTTPVLVARAGARISAPAIAGMRYRMLDWNLKSIDEGVIDTIGVFAIPADKPIYLIELRR
jgi:hypothetical protein